MQSPCSQCLRGELFLKRYFGIFLLFSAAVGGDEGRGRGEAAAVHGTGGRCALNIAAAQRSPLLSFTRARATTPIIKVAKAWRQYHPREISESSTQNRNEYEPLRWDEGSFPGPTQESQGLGLIHKNYN